MYNINIHSNGYIIEKLHNSSNPMFLKHQLLADPLDNLFLNIFFLYILKLHFEKMYLLRNF